MKIKIAVFILATAGAAFPAQTATADEVSVQAREPKWTVGVGALFRDKPYEDFDSEERWQPIPLVLYEGERFFVRGSNLGWKFVNTKPWEVSVLLEAQGDGYEASDSDFLDGMDDRDPYVGAGGQVIWNPEKFGIGLTATTDITSESDGYQAVAKAFWRNRVGPWMYQFSGSAIFHSDDYVDYYFGVKAPEAIPDVRPAYEADEETSFKLMGAFVYQRPDSPWLFLFGAGMTFYGDEIDDSPITDDDQEFMGVGAIGYTFGK